MTSRRSSAFWLGGKTKWSASWSSSTYNWYWLIDGLQDAGFQVHLANTSAIKQYEGLKHSGDETDAQHLAHLLRLGILPTGTILPREHRAVRDLARKRMQLVQSCTAQVLAVENIMARQLGGRMTSNQIKRLTDDGRCACLQVAE